MSGPLGSAQWMYASGAEVVQQSLKLNDDESQYLSWTPAAAGNRKTWTWSGWVKRGNLGIEAVIFSSYAGVDANQLRFSNNDTIGIYMDDGLDALLATNAVYRDASAWYHLVLAVDTTQATASNRLKLYVNGEQVTSFSTATYPPLNHESHWNQSGVLHTIADNARLNNKHLDGYLSDVYFIDGQALDPTSFGKFTNGYWEKKDYAGSYGANGFHLTFQDDVVSEGFNTVTYTGNGGTQSISGLGFEPDFVWIKNRNTTESHTLFDTIRGAGERLFSNLTSGDNTASNSLTSFDADGFSVGSHSGVNTSGHSNVAWCWDAGSGSPVSNTDGTITSTVKANPAYGFSIVSYTGTGANATVGHGLSSAPEMVIVKARSFGPSAWSVYTGMTGAGGELLLNTTAAYAAAANVWNNTAPTSSVFTVGTAASTNQNTATYIAYCFNSVAGYSKISSYTGTGAAGNVVTTGFRPAFLLYKRTDAAANDWVIMDTTRSPSNPVEKRLFPNLSDAEAAGAGGGIDVTDTGFVINNTYANANASGGTYIYMAFADTREAAFWKDVSGQGNHWTPNNLDYRDSLPDSPANNFATLNVLTKGTSNITLTEGNLKANAIASGSGGNWGTVFSSHTLPSTGKYYVEGLAFINAGVGNSSHLGILDTSSFQPAHNNITYAYTTGEGFDGVYVSLFNNNAQPVSDGVLGTAEGSLTDTTVLVMLAVDVDNGKVWAGYNGTWLNSGDPNAGTGEIATRTFTTNDAIAVGIAYNGSNDQGMFVNFGQDSTFAGTKPMGAYTDDNGIGNFQYAPPAGYLALCTANLPTPTIVDGSQHFNTVLYTGTGSTRSITDVGFSPDFLWIKTRSTAGNNSLMDRLRSSGTVRLQSDITAAEDVYGVASLDADGFTLSGGVHNGSGVTNVAWNWKAGGTAVSNTAGSITSQVSANVDAGFSIATYTGTGANASFGHGLGVAPDMVMVKRRDAVDGWIVFHKDLTSTHILILDSTTASFSSNQFSPDPSSSVVSILNQPATNASGGTYVAYSFANTEGYLKAGSYTGNGSSDGTFVYTGFRPAWVMVKRTDAAGNWIVMDSERDTYNVTDALLSANESAAESVDDKFDFLSNGFKNRDTGSWNNASGGSYIYLAFAETPLKFATAR